VEHSDTVVVEMIMMMMMVVVVVMSGRGHLSSRLLPLLDIIH